MTLRAKELKHLNSTLGKNCAEVASPPLCIAGLKEPLNDASRYSLRRNAPIIPAG